LKGGAFDASATALTAGCVAMYYIGLFALSFNLIFNKVFFSFKDTKTPMYISLITAGTNIVFDDILPISGALQESLLLRRQLLSLR